MEASAHPDLLRDPHDLSDQSWTAEDQQYWDAKIDQIKADNGGVLPDLEPEPEGQVLPFPETEEMLKRREFAEILQASDHLTEIHDRVRKLLMSISSRQKHQHPKLGAFFIANDGREVQIEGDCRHIDTVRVANRSDRSNPEVANYLVVPCPVIAGDVGRRRVERLLQRTEENAPPASHYKPASVEFVTWLRDVATTARMYPMYDKTPLPPEVTAPGPV